MTYTHMKQFEVNGNGQSVPKIQWKQTDGRTDGRTEAIALTVASMRSAKMAFMYRYSFKSKRDLTKTYMYVAEQRVYNSPTVGPVQMPEDHDMRTGND